MIDSLRVLSHTAEMAVHANWAAQFFKALIGGRFVTLEQTRDIADYILGQTKRNIESCPFASQEQKDAEIHRKENIMNSMKLKMGL